MTKPNLSVACAGIELRFAGAMADAAVEVDISAATELVGYAAKFGVRSLPLGGFVETIAPGAFDGVLEDDVVGLFNHDPNQVLGRSSAGSLRLSIDDTGLRYEIDLAGDEVSTRVASYVGDKRITQSSFAFSLPFDGGDQWDQQDDGVIVRTILRVGRLWDVSPVTIAAYPDAEVQLRSAFEAVQTAAGARRAAEIRRVTNSRARELQLLSRG